MKIGILTLPLVDNYGGILQAVALYRLLHNKEYDVILINKKYYNNDSKLKKILKKVFLMIPFYDFRNLKSDRKENLEKEVRRNFHKSFIQKEISNISKELYTRKELEDFVNEEKVNAVIVGSDQVWRKEYINDIYYKSYFLDFIENNKIKKIAYAASFGKDHWEGISDIEEISKCLKNFDVISTREISGESICRNTFGISNVKNTLDPTILIGREFYLDLISTYDTSTIPKESLLTYVLDEAIEKKEIIEYVQKNISAKNIHHLKGFNNKKTIYTIPEWIASFIFAETVVTDSFHGMVFSIIFEKDFIVIGNKDRGLDRFLSLLNLLKLEDRLIFNIEDLNDKKLKEIDYESVNKILDENRELSLNFLWSSLND